MLVLLKKFQRVCARERWRRAALLAKVRDISTDEVEVEV